MKVLRKKSKNLETVDLKREVRTTDARVKDRTTPERSERRYGIHTDGEEIRRSRSSKRGRARRDNVARTDGT